MCINVSVNDADSRSERYIPFLLADFGPLPRIPPPQSAPRRLPMGYWKKGETRIKNVETKEAKMSERMRFADDFVAGMVAARADVLTTIGIANIFNFTSFYSEHNLTIGLHRRTQGHKSCCLHLQPETVDEIVGMCAILEIEVRRAVDLHDTVTNSNLLESGRHLGDVVKSILSSFHFETSLFLGLSLDGDLQNGFMIFCHIETGYRCLTVQ
jgi:hypothetical protein